MYAGTVNSFLTWAHNEGLLPERLRVRLLPDPPKPLTPISDAEIRRIAVFRPHGQAQIRTWTLIVLLLDTGLHIDEALGLDRDNVDLHNCLIKVRGKGNKERWVPVSLECRKRLYAWLKSTTADAVFATRSGLRLTTRNAYRDIKTVCARAGVTGAHIHPHAFRHCFAVTYIRRGGDIYRLSRLLGHASITTTTRYLRSMGADTINEGHQRLSPLTRLRAVAALLLLTASLSAACSSLLAPDPACEPLRADGLVVSVAPSEHRVIYTLPAGLVADMLEVRINGRTVQRYTNALAGSLVGEPGQRVAVRAMTCGHWSTEVTL